MNFYIHKIQLWFTREDADHVTYEFEPNKVNVITGDSSTGKSSILRIIDYCLLAEESDIVEDVINESVKWYGLSFHMNDTDYIIVRDAPTFNAPGQSFYWKEETKDFPSNPFSNTSRANILENISCFAGVADKELKISKRKKLKLSFRNFLPFCYLTEDIIAAMNTYFDSKYFASKDIRDNISPCMDIVIGKDEEREQQLNIEKSTLVAKITREKKLKEKGEKEEQRYKEALSTIINKAYSSGLDGINFEKNQSYNMKVLYDAANKFKKSYYEDQDVVRLEEVETLLKTTNRKLYRLRLIENEIKQYNEQVDQAVDSLLPLDYLKNQFQQVLLYDETRILIDELSRSLQSIKKNNANHQKRILPADFQQRYDELTAQKIQLSAEKEALKRMKSQKLDFAKYESIVALYNELRYLKPAENKYIGDEALQKLQKKYEEICETYERLGIENKKCVNRLNEIILEYYNNQHSITSRYVQCKPRYDESRQALVLYNPISQCNVRNVGSKSNYMFLHLCFFLGLHELILQQEDSPVPSFLFIDQPSIPYYGGQKKTKEGKISDDDAIKLRDAFSMLDKFILRVHNFGNKKNFQIIMVEHATEDYWDDLKNFKTNYTFTKGDGLIPERVSKYYK